MSKTPKTTDVDDALDLLAGEIREEIQRIRDEAASAVTKGDYETAKSVIEFAGHLEKFAEIVDKLVDEWNSIAKQHDIEPEPVKAIVGKGYFGKARKGTITSHKDFYVPLLQALVDLGGKGKTQQVVDRVGKLMAGKLKPKDFETLSSSSETIRWRNKVMWTRNTLVNELGYMKNDSPFGIWEISEKGRTWLKSQLHP